MHTEVMMSIDKCWVCDENYIYEGQQVCWKCSHAKSEMDNAEIENKIIYDSCEILWGVNKHGKKYIKVRVKPIKELSELDYAYLMQIVW
jgi:hypothetical protein